MWCAIALAVYLAAPYDYNAAARFDPLWVAQRAGINVAVCGAFYSFWFFTLYGPLQCGRRKYKGRKVPGSDNPVDGARYVPSPAPDARTMLQDLWYWLLGVLQWTLWEVAFVHCYATGKLPSLSDEQLASDFRLVLGLGSPEAGASNGDGGGDNSGGADADVSTAWLNVARVVIAALFLPLWRSVHFYASHRFLHVRPMYRFVHSLHHRNVDIEPFAGLCMSPVEHAYYFACTLPSLYILNSPFLMLWNGYHLLLSPAASHAGWEDTADQFHYIHHATFEANYGAANMPFDALFGTFREKLGGSKVYKGAASADGSHDDAASANAAYTPKPLRLSDALPRTVWDAAYNAAYVAIGALVVAAVAGHNAIRASPRQLAFLAGAGPVLVAMILRELAGDRLPMAWPFHKEKLAGQFGWHAIAGAACTVMPTYHLVAAVLGDVGDSAYCWLWGGC